MNIVKENNRFEKSFCKNRETKFSWVDETQKRKTISKKNSFIEGSFSSFLNTFRKKSKINVNYTQFLASVLTHSFTTQFAETRYTFGWP